jgi:hypothetical protein
MDISDRIVRAARHLLTRRPSARSAFIADGQRIHGSLLVFLRLSEGNR